MLIENNIDILLDLEVGEWVIAPFKHNGIKYMTWVFEFNKELLN